MKAAQMIVRICGVLLILLGIAFWLGRGLSLVPLHMLLGIILVLALWFMAFRGLTLGVGAGLAAGAIIWGIITIYLGLAQRSLMPDSAHWVIQVIHLLVGIVAIGFGEMLGSRPKRIAVPA